MPTVTVANSTPTAPGETWFLRAVLGTPDADWYGPPSGSVVDLGCGPRKAAGVIGVDCVGLPGVDIVHDLNDYPYPFAESSVDTIYLLNVIEHLDSVCLAMDELYRLLVPGGILYVVTPHYTDPASWRDPQHKWHLNSYSFDYFQGSYYGHCTFTVVQNYVQLARLWRLLGIELLINIQEKVPSLRFFRRFWEMYFCYAIRAKKMYLVLRAEKPASPATL